MFYCSCNLLVTNESRGIFLDLHFEVRRADGLTASGCPKSLSELGKLWKQKHTHTVGRHLTKTQDQRLPGMHDKNECSTIWTGKCVSYPPLVQLWPCSCCWGQWGASYADSSPSGHECCLDIAEWSSWNTAETHSTKGELDGYYVNIVCIPLKYLKS